MRPSFSICAIAWMGIGFSTLRADERPVADVPAAVPSPVPATIGELLERHCIRCHHEGLEKGGVNLQTDEGWEQVDRDRLLEVIEPVNGKAEMPKTGAPLDEQERDLLKTWIAGSSSLSAPFRLESTSDRAKWWSLRRLTRPEIPSIDTNAEATARGQQYSTPGERHDHPIDRFVDFSLRRMNIPASPRADRRTLIRRVFFDMWGLPPTPDEIEQFLQDRDPQAYERLVDRLLDSPRYGERWARHWLDVVHYGDTHGYDKDKLREFAWPYRDYVIRALNDDKPHSQFIREQIAGDVLYPHDPKAIEATGFLVAGPFDWVGHIELAESHDKEITRNLDRDDFVASTLNTFMSTTIQCARCHDHKFDPISQREYYGLQAVFAGIDRANRNYDSDAAVAERRQSLHQSRDEIKTKLSVVRESQRQMLGARGEVIESRLAKLQSADQQGERNELLAEQAKLRSTLPDSVRREETAWEDQLEELDGQLSMLPPLLKVFAAASEFDREGSFQPTRGKARPIYLLIRGEVGNRGEIVEPTVLSCVTSVSNPFLFKGEEDNDRPQFDDHEEMRRAALARWIADSQNPLTWRSIVNRIWLYHFGRGIVETPNDFGEMGGLPSHPELLDWLAVEFRDGGDYIRSPQSWKQLHRLIVTSETYCRSPLAQPEQLAIDANNRYLGRGHRRRLEAEAVRDTFLQLAGQLDLTMYGPGFRPFQMEKPEHSPHYLYEAHDPRDPSTFRRSIYRFIVRSVPDPWFETLDCADPSQSVGRRNETLTPLSALALLNHPFVTTMSAEFAKRVAELETSLEGQVRAACSLALGRQPTDQEMEVLLEVGDSGGLSSICRVILNSSELMFID